MMSWDCNNCNFTKRSHSTKGSQAERCLHSPRGSQFAKSSHSRRGSMPPRISVWVSCLSFVLAFPLFINCQSIDRYVDSDSFIKFPSVSNGSLNFLRDADRSLEFQFRYCNDHGVLLYQSGSDRQVEEGLFFALGVNSGKIYLEWRVFPGSLIELYIGDGSLVPNDTHKVVIFNLESIHVGTTFATINSISAPVEYLTSRGALDMDKLTGELYVGGYPDVTSLRVATDRLNGYLVTCIDYVKAGGRVLDIREATELRGVSEGCPSDFCAPPTSITATSSNSYFSVQHSLPPGTKTVISLRFRTSSPNGIVFYLFNPAFLVLYLEEGRLVLGLNTRDTNAGSFASTTLSNYNNKEWHHITVRRTENSAELQSDFGEVLAEVSFESNAQTLSAEELYISGVGSGTPLPSYIPSWSRQALRGVFQDLRFISYSISPEPPELIDFDNQVRAESDIAHGAFPARVCDPPCPSPSQVCFFDCGCAQGFEATSQSPLQCTNINDCKPDPCLNGATCVDGILDYSCQCTIEFNKGKNCSIANFCLPSPCRNGAICLDEIEGPVCNCSEGYRGEFCQYQINECLSSPCQNGATCLDRVAGYDCNCESGFTGVHCAVEINECSSSPCQNGGVCQDIVNGFVCVCPSGWEGPTCSANINECASSPCQNGATCNDAVDSFSCVCTLGWEGTVCDEDVDECARGYCQNGASCTHGQGTYTCQCADGWEGKNCSENVDECLSLPCLHGGVCVDGMNGFTCECNNGFTGPICDEELDECVSQPCFHDGTCIDQINAFRCTCPSAWTGPKCEIEYDECSSSPCLNGGTCRDFLGRYECDCGSGLSGEDCEIDVDECASFPCQNEATCVDKVDGFMCTCQQGFKGTLCDLEVDECLSSPCENGAQCIDQLNGFVCLCSDGYTGRKCQVEINECSSDPCQNGGICTHQIDFYSCLCLPGFEGDNCEVDIDECALGHRCLNSAACVDGVNEYSCVCADGYEGQYCSVDTDECASTPCTHNATCIDIVNGFQCACPANFTGENCDQDVDECQSDPTPCNSVGTASCKNTFGGFQCICSEGFEGALCEVDLDECASDPCHFDGTCEDRPNGFVCNCGELFTGTTCQAVIRKCNFNPCSMNSVCIDAPSGGHTCFCHPGYNGEFCENDINECGSSPCRNGADCIDAINQYSCSCLPGYTGNQCEVDIDECASSPCMNGGVCSQPEVNLFECRCRPGFNGTRCEVNIDECAIYGQCEEYQVCIDLVNGFRCQCPNGTEGHQCEFSVDSCASQPCQNGATCVDGDFRYDCLCMDGFESVNCEVDIDVCDPNPCFHQGTCNPYPSRGLQFTCVCADGFTGFQCEGDIYDCLSNPCHNSGSCVENTDGTAGFFCRCTSEFTGDFCEIDRFSCNSQPCVNGATCDDTDTGIQCQCPIGFEGDFCQFDIDECANSPCFNNATCSNTPGSYTCICSEYFTDPHCGTDILECAALPPLCQHGGNCVEQIGAPPLCECLPGFEGEMCETEIDECSSSPCVNSATCFDLINAYACTCVPGYRGINCEIEIDECASNPCLNNATCTNLVNGFNCTCAIGYNGTLCEENTDECGSLPCLNGATCVDLIDSYECVCQPGFSGQHCGLEVDECVSLPCLNGGTCSDIINGFSCQCVPGYNGTFCEVEIDECESSPCVNGECQNLINGYVCECPAGYEGLHCEVDINECSSSPCYFNSTCTQPSVNLFQCTCNQGTTGRLCQTVTEVSFNGRRAIQLSPLEELVSPSSGRRRRSISEFTMSFRFATTLESGVLLYNQGVMDNKLEHIAIYLLDGALILSINNGLETIETSVSSTLNDGRHHKVRFYLGPERAGIVVDDDYCRISPCTGTLNFNGPIDSLELTGPFFVGGVGPKVTPYVLSKLQSTVNFTGCLQNLYVSDALVNLIPSGEVTEGFIPGCHTSPPCQSSPCLHEGECVDLWTGFECKCTVGYVGKICETQTSASFHPGRFLHFHEDESTKDVTSVKFSFSVSHAKPGVLMYLASGFALSLLNNDSLEAHLLELGGINSAVIGADLANGDWFAVKLAVSGTKLAVEVNNTKTGQRYQDALVSPPAVNFDMPLLFGDLHPGAIFAPLMSSLQYHDSFSGCIKDLSINGDLIGLQTAAPLSVGDPEFAEPGCDREMHCQSDPCRNGGTCNSQWEGFMCECSPDFYGTTCSLVRASTFNGANSYARVIVDSQLFAFGDEFGIEFRTRDEDGLLIHVGLFSTTSTRMDFMRLYLSRGLLHFETSFGLDDMSESLATNMTNAVWHRVYWERHANYINMWVDAQKYIINGGFPLFSLDRSPIAEVILGGETGRAGNKMFFQGCMQNLTLNNKPVNFDFPGDETPGLTVSNREVNSGCNSDDVCNPSPCTNTAYCVDMWNDYSCECLPGWEGIDCLESMDDCIGNLCMRGSTCVDGHMNYTCLCPEGLIGKLCQVEINVCEKNPCHPENALHCDHVFPLDYVCECKPGYIDKNCSTDDRLCTRGPCFNGGTCSQNVENTQFRCACPEFYEGIFCQDYNPCYRHECQNAASCVKNVTEYLCECVYGTYGELCQFTDSCLSVPCENGGTCNRERSDFSCDCTPYYRGELCEEPIDRCEENPCANNAGCIHDTTNPEQNFTCVCKEGYRGRLCQVDINECESEPCQNEGLCIESSNSEDEFFAGYRCNCQQGFEGTNCETNIDECVGVNCQNGGVCKDLVDGYECECAQYFEGVICEIDTRTCALSFCENNSTCEDLDNGFRCLCPVGYGGLHCQTVINICASNPCVNGGTCDYIGACDCSNAPNIIIECSGVESCERQACGNLQGCFIRDHPYMCDCTGLPYEGFSCEVDRNECSAATTHRCPSNERCINTEGGYSCNCSGTGFTGDHCLDDINECLSSPCQNRGLCINNRPFFECVCQDGYEGALCEIESNECLSQPCQNGGTCRDMVNGFSCVCSGTGYNGTLCNNNINECLDQTHQCTEGSTCRDIPGDYECICQSQYIGRYCGMAAQATLPSYRILVPILCFLTIILLISIVGWWFLKQSRKMEGKYNPAQVELVESDMPLAAFEVDTDERLV